MLSDAERLLIGMCRSYVLLRAKFGTPGQPTHGQFPLIQTFKMNHAVEQIAKLPADMTGIDVDDLMHDMTKKANSAPIPGHDIPDIISAEDWAE